MDAGTLNSKRRKLERSLDDVLAALATCDLARDIQNRMRRARDQRLTFASFPGRVDAHNNACERDLRPAVIQRKDTNSYRAMWSAKGEAAVRTVGKGLPDASRTEQVRRGNRTGDAQVASGPGKSLRNAACRSNGRLAVIAVFGDADA